MTKLFATLMLFLTHLPFIVLMTWLYKRINIKINNFRKAIYGFTLVLLCYYLYMILYSLLGGYFEDLAHGISFIVIPLGLFFVPLSIAIFSIHFIIKLVRNR